MSIPIPFVYNRVRCHIRVKGFEDYTSGNEFGIHDNVGSMYATLGLLGRSSCGRHRPCYIIRAFSLFYITTLPLRTLGGVIN